MSTTTTARKNAPKKRATPKPVKKAPAHRAATLTPYESAYYTGLGLVDMAVEFAQGYEKDLRTFQKKLVVRGQKRGGLLNRKAKELRKEAGRQVKEVRDAVQDEYHRVMEKVGVEGNA